MIYIHEVWYPAIGILLDCCQKDIQFNLFCSLVAKRVNLFFITGKKLWPYFENLGSHSKLDIGYSISCYFRFSSFQETRMHGQTLL